VKTRFGYGKEPKIFWSSLCGERATRSDISEALIQMGDWCSEELTPKQNETAALVKRSMTDKILTRK
jgi:hypothetical protein